MLLFSDFFTRTQSLSPLSLCSWIIAAASLAVLLALAALFGGRRLLRRRHPRHNELQENQIYLANLELQMRGERRVEEGRVEEEGVEEEGIYEDVV